MMLMIDNDDDDNDGDDIDHDDNDNDDNGPDSLTLLPRASDSFRDPYLPDLTHPPRLALT